jgi:MFS superfamily sulfate permease-like transporter
MFDNLKNDLPASVVVFFVALPLCLGIALASGAPLFADLISGIVGGLIVGVLSGSQVGVSAGSGSKRRLAVARWVSS